MHSDRNNTNIYFRTKCFTVAINLCDFFIFKANRYILRLRCNNFEDIFTIFH